MSPIVQRFLRWWSEPRIRLPAPGFRPEALHPGDRLQIGSRLWRVASRREAGPIITFEVIAAEGPPDPGQVRFDAGRWSITGEDGGDAVAVELDPAGVIHFAVSQLSAS